MILIDQYHILIELNIFVINRNLFKSNILNHQFVKFELKV
jgi:hypothetical protein